MTVGDRIKEQRELSRMSQVELAEKFTFQSKRYISMRTT